MPDNNYMEMSEKSSIRKANEILYVYENGFFYKDRPKDEWIPLHEQQYLHASSYIRQEGLWVPSAENMAEDFLLGDCFIRMNQINRLQGSKSTKTIQAFSNEDYNFERLAKRLNLPLPR